MCAVVAGPDHFAVLGVPRLIDVDLADLERRYLELAQQVHPDRYVQAEPGARRQAIERSAAVNEGYRVLRDPVRRAEYLCSLAGIDLDDPAEANRALAMEPGFLVEMIERRESLAEARQRGGEAVDELRDQVDAELREALGVALEALRNGRPEGAARALARRRYLQRLLDEIDDLEGLN